MLTGRGGGSRSTSSEGPAVDEWFNTGARNKPEERAERRDGGRKLSDNSSSDSFGTKDSNARKNFRSFDNDSDNGSAGCQARNRRKGGGSITSDSIDNIIKGGGASSEDVNHRDRVTSTTSDEFDVDDLFRNLGSMTSSAKIENKVERNGSNQNTTSAGSTECSTRLRAEGGLVGLLKIYSTDDCLMSFDSSEEMSSDLASSEHKIIHVEEQSNEGGSNIVISKDQGVDGSDECCGGEGKREINYLVQSGVMVRGTRITGGKGDVSRGKNELQNSGGEHSVEEWMIGIEPRRGSDERWEDVGGATSQDDPQQKISGNDSARFVK